MVRWFTIWIPLFKHLTLYIQQSPIPKLFASIKQILQATVRPGHWIRHSWVSVDVLFTTDGTNPETRRQGQESSPCVEPFVPGAFGAARNHVLLHVKSSLHRHIDQSYF
jgi:hypothetical protein